MINTVIYMNIKRFNRIGPILKNPFKLSEHVFYRFYNHAD